MARCGSSTFQFALSRHAETALFRQIVDAVLAAVGEGRLRLGDRLPTVSRLCQEHQLARETVLKAYGQLTARGILSVMPRHGYFVASETVARELNVFLLFDEFTPYKQQLYHGFKEALGAGVTVDLFFHHYNLETYHSLLRDKAGRYSHYVVMPFPEPSVVAALAALPTGRVLVLDRLDTDTAAYPRIGQEFATAVGDCLAAVEDRLRGYERLHLVLPKDANPYFPGGVESGVRRFCRRHHLPVTVTCGLNPAAVRKNSAWLVIDDGDLVTLVEAARAADWQLGRDLGILSYNDTPMKRVVANGISVISTDFAEMGHRAALFVRDGTLAEPIVPTRLIPRQSI